MKPDIGQGDSGMTSLLGGGSKVPKDSAQVEAYGSLDELVSLIGYIGTKSKNKELANLLKKIQDHLFRIESHVSASAKFRDHPAMPYVGTEHVVFLENRIAKYEKGLPKLENFILPGGTELSALLHIARAQSRAVERRLVTLSRRTKIHPQAIAYVNRLSDVFFTLALRQNHRAQTPEAKWAGMNKKGV